MTIYYVIFFILAVFSLTDVINVRREQRIVLFIASWLILWLFAGLRGDVFPDYSGYRDYFESLRQGVKLTTVAAEPGYIAINRIVGFFTGNAVWLFLLMSGIAVTINLKCYKDYTPFYFIAIMAYFSHTYLGRELMQIRAGVAAAIVLYSYRYVVQGSFKKFLFFIIIAATIHLGALATIVVYPIVKMNISRKTWYYILFGCLAIGFFFPLGAQIRKIPQMQVLERIQTYNDNLQYGGELGIFRNPTVLKQLFISFIGLGFYGTLIRKAWGYKVLLTSYLIATCWLILWNDYAILSARVATFFSITEVILLSSFVYLFEKRSQVIYLLWVILLTFSMLVLNITADRIPPYESIF